MKKNKLVVFITFVITTLVMTVLSGCSGQAGGGTPFSQAISGEEPVIWYECQNKIEKADEDSDSYIIEDVETPEEVAPEYGRETKVIWIKVYKDGKLSTYSCLGDVNLGHFSKMTDEEILKELDSDTDTYIQGQKDQPYTVYLYTDAAGQEVRYEGIPSLIKQSRKASPMTFMILISTDQVPTFQVYDSYYGGYAIYNYDETMLAQSCMVTRCNKGASFGLDQMSLEGAELDYKTPTELLSELNNLDGSEKKESKADTEEPEGEEAESVEDEAESEEGEEGEY